MRSLTIFLIIILCSSGFGTPAESLTLEGMLPEIKGWHLTEPPRYYTKENLYEYIDGNCELYFSYGFVKLLNAFYHNITDSSQEISVDIYDMGTSLQAFGVYSSMIYPDYEYDQIGVEAILSSQEIRFWQNHYEVEIRSNFSENAISIMKQFASTISQKIPAGELLPEFRWLVPESQLPHTLKYIATGFLGQDSLPGGFEAQYEINDIVVKGFVINCQNANWSKKYLSYLLRAQNQFKDAQIEIIADGFYSFHQYTGYMVVKQFDRWLYGAISESNREAGDYLAEKIRHHLYSINN